MSLRAKAHSKKSCQYTNESGPFKLENFVETTTCG